MNTRILNRDFQHPADGWYQIEALGNHPNRAAGVVQVIDRSAAESIVKSFNADAAAGRLRHGNEMLIDHEHFSDQPDQETRAYGWLQELQNRDDGIYGRIRWTGTGKTAVDGGDYRFFSTEYDPKDLDVLNDSKPQRVRPLKLAGLTLTNMNNNRGQKPITNRQDMSAKTEQEMTEAEIKKLVNRILKNKKSPYMNGDGTFKGGFKGCMAHMQNEEGHSEESAQKLCGYIAQNVANRFTKADQKILNDAEDGDPTPDEDAEEASNAAHSASMAAEDEPTHKAAAESHRNAQKLHKREGNDDQSDFHGAMANHHDERAKCCGNDSSKSDDDEGNETKTKNKEQMKDIAKLLGLSQDADEKAVSEAITKLKNRLTELETEQSDTLLDACNVKDEKIRARMKDGMKVLSNREERLGYLADFGYAPGKSNGQDARATTTRVLNRMGRVPETTTDTDDEQALAQKITNRAQELQGKGLKYDAAWNQARRELAKK